MTDYTKDLVLQIEDVSLNLSAIAEFLERIADAQERIADALQRPQQPDLRALTKNSLSDGLDEYRDHKPEPGKLIYTSAFVEDSMQPDSAQANGDPLPEGEQVDLEALGGDLGEALAKAAEHECTRDIPLAERCWEICDPCTSEPGCTDHVPF